jgi:starvation-inducible DNA-binding protein
MKPNIKINDSHRAGVVAMLNALLADEFVLGTQTRNCHWNVTGPRFHDLHKFLDAQYEELDAILDDVAERARALGGRAAGTLGEFLNLARLRERPGKCRDAQEMTAKLLDDQETVIRQLRGDVDKCARKYADAGTADFLTGLMEQHEKMAWMLRAILEGKN